MTVDWPAPAFSRKLALALAMGLMTLLWLGLEPGSENASNPSRLAIILSRHDVCS